MKGVVDVDMLSSPCATIAICKRPLQRSMCTQVWKGLLRGTEEIAIWQLAFTEPPQPRQLMDAVGNLCRIAKSPHVVQAWSPTQCMPCIRYC